MYPVIGECVHKQDPPVVRTDTVMYGMCVIVMKAVSCENSVYACYVYVNA